MLKKLGKNSQLHRLNVRASVKGRFGKNTVQTALSYGHSTEEQGRIVNAFASAEVDVPQKSFEYKASFEGKVIRPQINNRWNTKLLLQEDLKMELDGQIKYGRKEHTKEISFKTVLE